jgi:phosphoadenosine phosphosulfate reductase
MRATMLIPSHRHTAADLRLWAELEESDAELSNTPKLDMLISSTISTIQNFSVGGPCYAGISMGKESVLLAYLVHLAKVNIPLVWLSYGRATNPDCFTVRDALLPKIPGRVYHEIDVGDSEKMRDDFMPAEIATGAKRYLSGVRAEESGTRKMSIRSLGITSKNTCRPLAWWKIGYVFAALHKFNLPVHPVYAMLGGGRWPREHLRTASIGGNRATGYGRRQHEQEYYGDVLNRLSISPASTK